MKAIVYRCRAQGQRLGPEAIRAAPAGGDLIVRPRGFNRRIALLLGADGERYVLPLLDKVRVLAINEHGVLLAGYEMHPARGGKENGPVYPQAWWCVLGGAPVVVPASAAEVRAKERAREAGEIGRTMVNHYGRRQ